MARVEADLGDLPEFANEAEGSFGYDALHAPYVEWDTTYSSPPPYDEINPWVERKWNDLPEGLKLGALADDEKQARERASNISRSEWQKEVTFMIMFAIEENGIEGVHMTARGAKKAREDAQKIAQQYEDSDDPDAAFKIIRDILDFAFGISQDIIADEATDRGSLLQSGFVSVEQLSGGSETFEREGR